MRFKLQLIVESEQESQTTELMSIERNDLNSGSIGLHLSEAKTIVENIQSTMVTTQVEDFVGRSRFAAEESGCVRK